MWNGSSYYNATLPNTTIIASQEAAIEDIIKNGKDVDPTTLFNLTPFPLYAGTAIQITNYVIKSIDSAAGLPLEQPAIDINTGIPTIGTGTYTIDLGVTTVDIPTLTIDADNPYHITIPKIDLFPKLDTLPNYFPTFNFPDLPTTLSTNTLSSKNEFLNFSDKDDRKLGSVVAESTTEWLDEFLNPTKVTEIMADVAGLDLAKDYLGLLATATEVSENFNNLGVQYTSGHGDYAEWLERKNKDEFISAGDIVAVKGGKITKDLKDAEQVMVVSHKPVVLGNMPPEGEEGNGNKVAFMGQVPVKIMGPVSSGDYILAEGNIPGYGVAKNPNKMTAADFKLSVGRAWEQNLNEGPKMINTLIGVDNGDYLKILQNNQKQINETNQKVDDMERRLQMLEKLVPAKTKSSLSNFSRN